MGGSRAKQKRGKRNKVKEKTNKGLALDILSEIYYN